MSSIAANGGTVPLGEDAGRSQLKVRIASALVLAPIVAVCIYFGSPWFDLLAAAAVAVMAWEWARLCGESAFAPDWLLVPAVALAALIVAAQDNLQLAASISVAGAVVVTGLAFILRRPLPMWAGGGTLLIALAGAALVWLRGDTPSGALLALWFFGTIWMTDIFAYVAGRAIGGPKLAPAISPKKTWAGLIGGVVASATFSALWPGWIAGQGIGRMALWGAGIAVVAQVSDLTVSRVKRLVHVKDTGRLIPGHGGLLDRVDGFLLTGAVVFLLALSGRGGALPWL